MRLDPLELCGPTRLATCSLAARGLYASALAAMDLRRIDAIVDAQLHELATWLRCSHDEAHEALRELERAGLATESDTRWTIARPAEDAANIARREREREKKRAQRGGVAPRRPGHEVRRSASPRDATPVPEVSPRDIASVPGDKKRVPEVSPRDISGVPEVSPRDKIPVPGDGARPLPPRSPSSPESRTPKAAAPVSQEAGRARAAAANGVARKRSQAEMAAAAEVLERAGMRDRATRVRLAEAYGLAACARARQAATERGKGPGFIERLLRDGDVSARAETDDRVADGRAVLRGLSPEEFERVYAEYAAIRLKSGIQVTRSAVLGDDGFASFVARHVRKAVTA